MNSKKSNISRVLLSMVALLAIVAVGIGVTYSWIEGGDQYSLIADDIEMAQPAHPISGAVDNGTVTLDPSQDTTINLLNPYDNYTDTSNLVFTPLSSNGTDFFLPMAYADGAPTYFRESTTNDLGTKYIEYDFNVKSAKQCYLAFASEPVITVTKGGKVLEASDTDTSALRFMISNGTDFHIFSTPRKDDNPESGMQITAKGYTYNNDLVVKSFSDYLNEAGKKRLFSYSSATTTAETYTVAIWLDCFGSADSLEALSGSTIDIEFNLVVDQEKVNINFKPITLDCNGEKKATATEGGTVTPTSDKFVIGETLTSTAKVSSKNYTFLGWFKSDSDFTDTNKIGSDLKLSYTTPDKETTYYAVFKEKPQYTISAGSKTFSNIEGTGGTVTVGGNADSYKNYEGTSVQLIAKADEGYRFAGWFTDEDCNSAATDITTSTGSVTISANKSYYAKFVKTYKVTLSPVCDGAVDSESASSLEIKLSDGSKSVTGSSAKIELTVDYNSTVNLSASENDTYELDGIFTTMDGTTNISSIVVNDDIDLYARFTKKLLEPSPYRLMGGVAGNDWTNGLTMYYNNADTSSNLVYSTVTLSPGTYEFKVRIDEQDTWYTNTSLTITDGCTNYSLADTTPLAPNCKFTATVSNTYTFIFNTKDMKISVTSVTSGGSIPSATKLANQLVFNFGSTKAESIWYWSGSGTGSVKVPSHKTGNNSDYVSTYSTTSTDPKAIVFKTAYTASPDWPAGGDDNKLTGDITKSSSVTYTDNVYYTNSTDNTNWKKFDHLTATASVPSTANVGSIVDISANSTGSLKNNYVDYTYYVQKDSTVYRVGKTTTTATTMYWLPNEAGTYTVKVVAKDDYGLETAVGSATIVVN